MFLSRRTNIKINTLHKRALRIIYDDDFSTLDQFLAIDKSFCIHHQNIQRLLTEIYRALHDISGNSLKELFVKRESTTSLRSKPELVITTVNSVLKGKNSLTILLGKNCFTQFSTRIAVQLLLTFFIYSYVCTVS